MHLSKNSGPTRPFISLRKFTVLRTLLTIVPIFLGVSLIALIPLNARKNKSARSAGVGIENRVKLLGAFAERTESGKKNIGAWLRQDSRQNRGAYSGTAQKEIEKLYKLENRLKGFLHGGRHRARLPRFTLGIFRDNSRVFGTDQGLNHDSPRALASVSKIFTAVGVVQLAERGLLSLEDDIVKYFPELPQARKPKGGIPITVADVLRHSSGIPYSGRGGGSIRSAVRKIRYHIPGQTRPAGKAFHYSNQNYYLLGALIEKVSGESYPDYITNQVLKPLGMVNSRVGRRANAASGIVSTINELQVFYKHLMHPATHNNILISTNSLMKMLEIPSYANPGRNKSYFGLGLKVRFRDGQPWEIYHNGRWTNTAARLSYFINENCYMVYLGAPVDFRAQSYQSYHWRAANLSGEYIKQLGAILNPDKANQ